MEERIEKIIKDFRNYKPLSEIGEELGISRERARVLLNRHMDKRDVRRIKSRRSNYYSYMLRLKQNYDCYHN